MSKTISLTISNEKYALVEHEANSKGLKPSEFIRMALFSHINKYPSKGIMAELARIEGYIKP